MVLCRSCERQRDATIAGEAAERSYGLSERTPEWERFETLLCSGCGTILPAADMNAIVLGTLTRLGAFGLSARERALLRPNRRVSDP